MGAFLLRKGRTQLDGIKRYGFNDRPQMLFDSAGNNEGYYNSAEQNALNETAGKNLDEVAKALRNLSPSQQAETSSMWSQMRGASEYNIYGQRAVESMLNMRNNEDVVVFDIEAIGQPTHMRKEGSAQYFSPTELALHKGKYVNGKLNLGNAQHSSLSMLMKPNQETETHLRGSINQLKKSGWRGLDADTTRSLTDLSAYAGDPTKHFKTRQLKGTRYTEVLSHAQKLTGNASLATPEAISKIEQGLNNIVNYGTVSKDAVNVLDNFIPNKRGSNNPVRMIGYNIYNYDELALKEAFEGNVAKHSGDSTVTKALGRLIDTVTNKSNVDLFHALKTTTENPSTKFGRDMTLTTAYDVLVGHKKPRQGTAHHGLTDVGYTADIFGQVKSQVSKADALVKELNSSSAKVQDRATAPFFWDKTPLKSGMELYSFNGLASYQSGEYDGIFKKTDDGSFEKSYAMKQNPVYARTMYKVDRFLEDVTLGGKKYFGIQLTSDEGQHLLFRETREDLQKAVHGHFLPVSKYGIQKDAAMTLQNEDRGMRRYNKMFAIGSNSAKNDDKSDGFNLMKRMYEHLGEVGDFKKQNGEIDWKAGTDHLKKKYEGQPWMTDSYVRDLETMAPRLKAEEGIWKGFMDEAKQLGTNAERTIALRNFRDVLQENVGENKSVLSTGGEPTLPLKIGDKTSYLRGLDRNGMVQTIRRNVERGEGQIGKSNREVMVNRFNELIENNLIPAFNSTGDKSMTKKMRNIQSKFHKEVMANNKVSTIYEEVATMVGSYMNAAFSTSQGMEIERVSGISAQYASNLKGFSMTKNKPNIQKAINDVAYFGHNLDGFLSTGSVKEHLDKQKQHASDYLGWSGLKGETLNNYNGTKFSNVTDIESKVKRLTQEYMKQGFRVQMFHSKERGLSMGIMDKNAPESLARSGYLGLRQSSNAAVIHLPGFAEGGKIQWRGEQHLNRFVGNVDRGQLSIGTVYDDVFESLTKSASFLGGKQKKAQVLGKKDFFINAEAETERMVRKVLERSPMDYNKGYVEDDSLFKERSAKANVNRSYYLDTSKFAEQWYRESYEKFNPTQRKRLGFNKSYEDIKSSVGYTDSFMDKMGYLAKTRFNSEVDQWAQDKWGLQTNSHGVNNVHMSKGYRSLIDPRRMSAFAAFDKTSGENRQKSLNYYPLDADNVSSALKSQGESEALVKLRTNYGTNSDFAPTASIDELTGVSVRTAYMTDEQVSKSIATNRAKINTELKKMLGSKEITMEDYNKYQSMLDNGQLSVYEGKAIMANKFKQVFDVVDDVRERLGDGYELNGDIQKALGSQAKKLGMDFNINESIYFGNDQAVSVETTQRLMGKDGKITVGSLVVDGKMVPQVYDARSNKEVFIKGWNADEQMLILGKHNRGEDSMKTVSNTGRRHIETFVPQKIIETISGIEGTEAIVPHFGKKKEMDGAVLEEKVRVYEDELLRQVHGVSPQSAEVKGFIQKNGITVGTLAKNGEVFEGKAIRELLLPKLQKHFGVGEDVIKEAGGRVSVSNTFGFDEKYAEIGGGQIKSSVTSDLDKEMGKVLNYQFRKDGVEVGQTIKQRHDVWADQYATGMSNKDGRVRIGLKELGALREHSGSAIGDFFQGEVRSMSKGGRESREVGQYIMNTMASGYTPKAGDIVFDTSALRPEIKDVVDKGTNANVEVNARIGEGGVLHVNPDTINPLPQITAKHTKIYSDQYAQTLLDTGRLKFSYQDENGNVVNNTVNQHLKGESGQFKGTAYLKLPDNSFGQDYMPLIDFQNMSRQSGEGSFLNEMQRTQRNVVDKVNSYNNLGSSGTIDADTLLQQRNDLQQEISKGLGTLREQANSYMTGGSKGSFLGQTANARLDMSGHFRAEGVNPFMQYSKEADGKWKSTGNIKENVAYLNKADVLDMISGAEDNIINTWKQLDTDKMSHVNISKMDTEAKQNFIVENMNDKGIYGTTIRYPIIDNSTIQTTKFETADWVGRKSMYMGNGAISRMAGDFDGDNLAAMMTTYKSEKAALYHETYKKAYEKEAVSSEYRGQSIMNDLEKDIRDNLKEQGRSGEQVDKIVSTLQRGDVYTVGDLAKSGFDQDTISGVLRAKTHAMDNVETVIARTGKEFIGHIDNARQRISTLHTITQRELSSGDNPFLSKQAAEESIAMVDEVTRRLSQESISSKKFTVQTLIKDEEFRNMTKDQQRAKALEVSHKRNDMLAELRNNLYDPNMDVNRTVSILKDIGVIGENKTTSLEVGIGREKVINKMTDEELFTKGLMDIQKTNRVNQHVGGFNALSLKAGASQGVAQFDEILQTGRGYVHTNAMQEYYAMANDDVKVRMDNYREAHRSGVIRQYQQNQDAESLQSEMRETSGAKIEGRTILQDNYIHKQEAARFKDVLDTVVPKRAFGSPVAGSMAAGAVGFGAIWAASAALKTSPTPEGMREQAQGPAVPVDKLLTTPTARITENNGEHINIQVNAKSAKNMSHSEVAALVNQELQGMSAVQMNMNLNVNDNSQQIDQKWLQDLVANAMNKGYGFSTN